MTPAPDRNRHPARYDRSKHQALEGDWRFGLSLPVRLEAPIHEIIAETGGLFDEVEDFVEYAVIQQIVRTRGAVWKKGEHP